MMKQKQQQQNRPKKTLDFNKGEQKKKKDNLKRPSQFSTRSTIANFNVPIQHLTEQNKVNLIAELSEAILQDPTTAFTTPDLPSNAQDESLLAQTKFQKLLEMATMQQYSESSRLATLSLMAIFQDIAPSYRIRPPTAVELAVKVSKETKNLWDFERALLSHYQIYLKLLEKKSNDPQHTVSVTAVLCLCELLTTLPHFNFRSNILAIVVKNMNHKSCDEISNACCQAISNLFAKDLQGEISLEATRLICNMVKDHTLKLKTDVIQTFLSLPLRVHEDEAQAAKLMDKANAKKRKRDQDLADAEKDLKEGDATIDKVLLATCQAETLQRITLTYFRILKSVAELSETQTPSHPTVVQGLSLLPVALQGLARFSHLIHFDAVTDLLHVLKKLVQRDDILSVEASLNCLVTALQTLQGPGKELPVDPKEFIIPLYNQLPRLITETHAMNHTQLALKCMHLSFIKRKDFSSTRVTSFVKRLCMVSLHTPSFTSAAFLAFSRQMLQKYPSISQLLENDQELVPLVPLPSDLDDPDHADVSSTTAWEISNLRFHVNPLVSSHADRFANQAILQLPMEEPSRIFTQGSIQSGECFIPYQMKWKKHPLSEDKPKNFTKSRKRQQIRFITPRKTKEYHLMPTMYL